ncbi:MAG TPA: bifunctional 3-(3-hydroxy-phenyl)propionate/3-hydroxycinnamic acid hydroxylase, partial [Ramlibacter sp.]|nr:bifunctional 3-(3-hydroxy-phenyl)propionate/3-hydroxycinnamic acid hydroxylase [Ramlibacter sp.]
MEAVTRSVIPAKAGTQRSAPPPVEKAEALDARLRGHDVQYDVAIAGFGPAGAVAAALLGQAGLKVYACDRLTGVYEIPRAISLDHEILRLLQQLGLEEQVAQHCEPFTPSEYFGVDGQLIRRMTMVEPPHPQGYTPSIVFTQPPVERLLRERVAQMPGVTVELGVEVVQVAQGSAAASLQVVGESGPKTVTAKYLIACDGGSSTVRGLLDLPLEDLDFDEPWLVVDVLVNERGLAKLPKVSVQYCEPERPCTLVIGPKNHRRWEISLKPGEDPKEAATPGRTWELLSRWLTPDDGQLWRQASYRFHALVAERWRAGRVFLAGDAAHMQPPFLGQGMCQGVRDVANLTWKLAAVLRGEVTGDAAEALLDSYGAERKAHVRELTSRIKAIGAVICERDVAKARARDAKLLADCGGAVKDTPRQDVLPRLETGLLSAREHPARGSLFPQPWVLVDGERRRLDAVAGNGWRLVLAADQPLELPSGLRRVVIGAAGLTEADGVVAAWFERHGCAAALVRPDHYVYGVAASDV